jgi:hypothetical protein
VNITGTPEENTSKSKACTKSRKGDETGRKVPLDILGGGRRWPKSKGLDRATWEKILWREVGR